jgi:hypothetical protein
MTKATKTTKPDISSTNAAPTGADELPDALLEKVAGGAEPPGQGGVPMDPDRGGENKGPVLI